MIMRICAIIFWIIRTCAWNELYYWLSQLKKLYGYYSIATIFGS